MKIFRHIFALRVSVGTHDRDALRLDRAAQSAALFGKARELLMEWFFIRIDGRNCFNRKPFQGDWKFSPGFIPAEGV